LTGASREGVGSFESGTASLREAVTPLRMTGVCYNSACLYVIFYAFVRKWWNWQTHHLEGVAPKGVGVQIPPSAPI
jgi:hypothetical protein